MIIMLGNLTLIRDMQMFSNNSNLFGFTLVSTFLPDVCGRSADAQMRCRQDI